MFIHVHLCNVYTIFLWIYRYNLVQQFLKRIVYSNYWSIEIGEERSTKSIVQRKKQEALGKQKVANPNLTSPKGHE